MSRWTKGISGRIVAALIILGGGLGGTACNDDAEPLSPTALRIESISLGSPTAPAPQIEPLDTYQLVAEAFDKEGNSVSLAGVTLAWSSSDDAIAPAEEPPTYAPQINPGSNTAWLEIEVLP